MNRIALISTLAIMLTTSLLYGQMKRADSFYNKEQYAKALPLYKKEIKKTGSSKAVERLAICFWETKNYREAETYFSKLSRGDKIHPSYFFYYGVALYKVGKIKEAYRQFYIYSEMQPMERRGFDYMDQCDHAKYLQTLQKLYEVSSVDELNTKNSEFAPSYFKNSLVFTAEKRGFNMKKGVSGNPYYDVYYSSFNKNINRESFYNLVKLPRSINTKYHDGPACFNGLNNQMIFTRQEKGKGGKDAVSGLYLIKMEMNNKMEKNKWERSEPFKFNNDSYSLAQPSLSYDGQYLYFASDMPGGYGGMDIYVCERWRGRKQWTDPVNLGPEINSSGDELYPYIRSDGTLFFSSDARKGFGGLDIYSASQVKGKWTNVENVGAPINSTTNDFAIIFADDFKSGFFSSDRIGGKGAVDLYRFDMTMKYRSMEGNILYSETKLDPAINTKILLISELGDTIADYTTDSTGHFRFNNLLPDKGYAVKIDEKDTNFISFYNYFLMDKKDSISLLYLAQSYEDFVYQTLPADKVKMEKVDDEDRTTLHIAGNIFIGDQLDPLANAQLNLLDTEGSKIDSTETNMFGSFVFASVPKDESVEIKIGENENLPGNTKITLTNAEGKELIVTTTDSSGKFNFEFLSSDENILSMAGQEEDTDLDITGRLLAGDGTNRPIVNSKVDMLSNTGKVLKSTRTDSTGWFGFKKLNKEENYLFGLDEKDPQLKGLDKVLLADEEGNVKTTIQSDKDGKFRFRYLSHEYHTLEKMEVEDTELKVDLKGKLLADDANSSPIAETKIDLLNDQGKKLDSTITDKEGSFEFSGLPVNEDYVFALDEKDPKVAKKTKIILTDEKGNKVKELKSDAEGKFRYKLLPSDVNKMGKMYVEDPWLNVAALSSKMLQKVDSFTITESIYYEIGAWEILPEAAKTLNKIITIMKNDSTLSISFTSHTDSRSSDAFNLRLSQQRADAIVAYFIKSGIASDRISGKGLGETKLINHCKNAVPCTEEQHAQNRRAEFKVFRK